MTRGSSNWRNRDNHPFRLNPAGKDYLWGGRRLKEDFSKEIDMEPLAETWECSTHPDGLSTVSSGKFKGRTLRDVLAEHPEYLGEKYAGEGDLPILIKFIDAKEDLSVQVHPDDEYAGKYEHGARGKSEMWYVLDAQRDTELVYGFCRDLDEETLRRSLQAGTIEKYLQKVPVRKDDVFYIPAGQVHAIGAGALIAEIQRNSNLTYRLFDYNRLDKDGKPRPLHIGKGVEAADLKGGAEPRQPLRVLQFRRGYATELLCRCQYFRTERMLLNTERWREGAAFRTERDSFKVLLCTEGVGILTGEAESLLPNSDWESLPLEERPMESLHFIKGDCIFVPADSMPLRLHGKARLLVVGC